MSKLFIANWKSNKNREQVELWMDEFENTIKAEVALERMVNDVVICPAMPSIMFVSNRLQNRQLHAHTHVGVQDISAFPAGAYTGAVSAENLVGFSVEYAILGHSERRKYFHETSELIAKKVEQCLHYDITPIICVDVNDIKSQADVLEPSIHDRLIVAYEPVEHIGTGIAEESAKVLETIAQIRQTFRSAKVIYGGSINGGNIDQFITHPEIEGFLVGSTSLDPVHFAQICKK